MLEQESRQARVTDMPVAALLDEGIIDRWAKLFASRYRMPARTDEFAARIVGAIAEKPVLASAVITSDAELARVFEYARTVIEGYVGRSVLTVSDSVRTAFRTERSSRPLQDASRRSLGVKAVA